MSLNAEQKKLFLENLEQGLTNTQAAQHAGSGHPTVWRHCKSDTKFAEACEDARIASCQANLEVLETEAQQARDDR